MPHLLGELAQDAGIATLGLWRTGALTNFARPCVGRIPTIFDRAGFDDRAMYAVHGGLPWLICQASVRV